LAYGLEEERVRLVELPVEECAPILRVFPKKVPGGISFFRSMYGLPKEKEALSEAFATLAPRCAASGRAARASSLDRRPSEEACRRRSGSTES
jgi:hypothetical protein